MNVQQALTNILNTLGTIEVKGRENLDKLLGCIILTEKVRDALTPPPETEATDEKGE